MTIERKNEDTESLVNQIFQEFERLQVSVHDDPFSGLSTRLTLMEVEHDHPDLKLVEVYDDYAVNVYDGERLLAALKGCEPERISLSSYSEQNIWQFMRPFEVEWFGGSSERV